ncbi:sigma factor [Paenibacillus thiaminolyticus]|uniref:sigma factor n=1 Tax=Paenibacillus thiaminolyticus TaxID=49283 RepID=UPI003D28040F
MGNAGSVRYDLETALERYKHPLYRYCLHLCGPASDADDLFQDVWIRAMSCSRERFLLWLR